MFAALSYAVTQSTRSGGGDASKETTDMKATQLVQYATGLTNTLMRMRLTGGCSDNQLSFYHASFTYDYTNTVAPVAGGRCDVFHPSGGAAVATKPPADVVPAGALTNQYWFHGCMEVGNVGTTGSGAAAKELIVQAFVTKDVCLKINQRLGITNPGGNPPQYDYGQTDPASAGYCQYVGNYVSAIVVGIDQPGFAYELSGQPTGCYENTADHFYRFYHAMVTR